MYIHKYTVTTQIHVCVSYLCIFKNHEFTPDTLNSNPVPQVNFSFPLSLFLTSFIISEKLWSSSVYLLTGSNPSLSPPFSSLKSYSGSRCLSSYWVHAAASTQDIPVTSTKAYLNSAHLLAFVLNYSRRRVGRLHVILAHLRQALKIVLVWRLLKFLFFLV